MDEDNGVLAGNGSMGGYFMRTVDFNGEMLAFTVRRTADNKGVLSQAVKLIPRKEGGLSDIYWEDNDKLFGPMVRTTPGMIQDHLELNSLPDDDRAYMVTAKIRLIDDCAAGITFGQTKEHPGYTFFLDPKNRKMELVTTYRRHSRRGSVTRRKSHSSERSCIHCGAMRLAPARKSNAAPTQT